MISLKQVKKKYELEYNIRLVPKSGVLTPKGKIEWEKVNDLLRPMLVKIFDEAIKERWQ